MGAAGAGKTTVGLALAATTGWRFHDADDLHPSSNVERIRQGSALTDDDRLPWLERVRMLIARIHESGGSAVVACSALRDSYRRAIAGETPDVRWVFLQGTPELLGLRLASRHGHFAGPAILDDQLRTLEKPIDALTLDARRPVNDLVMDICGAFRLPCGES
jgi:carbohydrate kinase (thermoresistant glucokinase family)